MAELINITSPVRPEPLNQNFNSLNDELEQIKGAGYDGQTIKQNYDLIKILENNVEQIVNKVPVENYKDLATEYPNPEIGFAVFVKGTDNISERSFYYFMDGINKIQNGVDNANWIVLDSNSVVNPTHLHIVATRNLDDTGEDGIVELPSNLIPNTEYTLTYEIKDNSKLFSSTLYVDNNIIDNHLALDTSLGKHSVSFTTKSIIDDNKLRLILNNGYISDVSVDIQVISVKTDTEKRWYRDTELIPLASETNNGLLSKEDYTEVQKIPTIEDNVENLQLQVDNIVATPNDGNVEITQARVDINNINHDTLKDRLDSMEKKNYFWIEEKTVEAGGNSFILDNELKDYMTLEIFDLNYGAFWKEGVHYTVSGQTVTFTEDSLPETFTFRIKAI